MQVHWVHSWRERNFLQFGLAGGTQAEDSHAGMHVVLHPADHVNHVEHRKIHRDEYCRDEDPKEEDHDGLDNR